MYQLEEKIYFYGFVILPVMVLLFLGMRLWQSGSRKRFGELKALNSLSPNRSALKPWLKLILVLLGISALIGALINLKVGTRMETVKREGLDIVFAIDVSKSMLAEDIAPNRLEKAKRIVSEIINNLSGDRIGIVAYAGQAFPTLPITTDYGVAKMYLQNMDTDMLSSQGTAIGEALGMAAGYFDEAMETNKVVVLLSDGEDHEKGADEVAEELAGKGIVVLSLGVGTAKGGPIPIKYGSSIDHYKKDANGEVVITHLQEEILNQIAVATGGSYLDASDTSEAVEFVNNALTGMDRAELETRKFADFKDQFQWFLGAALIFLILDSLLLNGRTAWLKKLNLFNERESKQ